MARLDKWVGWILPLLLGASAGAQSGALYFVPADTQVLTSWKGVGRLGRLDDQEVALALPSSSATLEVRKFLPLGAVQAFLGDPGGKGDYTSPFLVGEIDALFYPSGRGRTALGGARDLFMSVTRRSLPVFEGGKTRVLRPADVFRWKPGGEVQVFLPASLLEKALGFQSPTLDLDALCVDPKGDVFFSLALDEPYPNPKVLDGDLLVLPAAALQYGPEGRVKDVRAGAALRAARESDLDQWVAASGLASSQGTPIKKVGNLSCLALDPGGGTFLPPALPSFGPLPNLVFGGSGKGWALGLCSTAGKGSLAKFGGVSLGSATKTRGTHLGVESLSGGPSDTWVCALAFGPPPHGGILLEEDRGGRFLSPVSQLTFEWGGVAPGREALLLLAPGPSGPGRAFPSLLLPPSFLGGPWEVFWRGGPLFLRTLGFSGKEGRGKTVLALPPSFTGPALLTAQAFGPTGPGRLDLSLPQVLQWW